MDSSNQVPDGNTVERFRNILVKNGIQQKLFPQVVEILKQKGSFVDSMAITVSSSVKNKEKSATCNPEKQHDTSATSGCEYARLKVKSASSLQKSLRPDYSYEKLNLISC